MFFIKVQRRFGNDDQRVQLRECLRDQIDPRVVGVEAGPQHFAALDEFAMPAILAKSFFHCEDLTGMRAHEIFNRWCPAEIAVR